MLASDARPLRSTVTNVCGARKVAFLAIDQSKDGKVTEGELVIWFKNRAKKTPSKFTYKPNQSKGALKKRDKNKDGTMSLDEWIRETAQKN